MESKDNNDSDYEDTTNAEDYSQYKLDGYHPVYISENYNNSKYTIIQKLGWGHFSTVWLIKEKLNDNYYALKIQKSKSNYFEAAMDELDLLNDLNKTSNVEQWNLIIKDYNEKLFLKKPIRKNETFVIKLIDSFVHIGMHGKHPCSILELMGPNLLDLIQFHEHHNTMMNLSLVKHITKQVLLGLDYMHRVCKIIHTDLKPENIMIKLPENKTEDFVKRLNDYKKKPLSMKFLKYLKTQLGKKNINKKNDKTENDKMMKSDPKINDKLNNMSINEKEKEKNSFDEKFLRWKEHILIPLDEELQIKIVDFGNGCWTNKHFTSNIQTREYRSLEVILGIDYESNTDIWSLACLVFEMITNTFLFKPRKGENYEKNDDHLALMIETLGPIPYYLISAGKFSGNYFNKDGSLTKINNIKEYRIKDILTNEFKFDVKKAQEIEDFLLPMLEYDPKKRVDAKTALKSTWLWN